MKLQIQKYLYVILFILPFGSEGQEDTLTLKEQGLVSVHIDRRFDWKYKLLKEDVLKVYPLAIEAKNVIEQYEKDLAEIEKKRKQKKYLKESEKELKLNFEYTIKDLYVSEGKLLMKLIHRETGMTVDDILRKYKGNFSAGTTGAALKLFGHDTKIEYDPEEDWIIEVIIQDIISGKIKTDLEPRQLTKQDYKDGMKEYRDDRSETRKVRKVYKKKKRQQKRESK